MRRLVMNVDLASFVGSSFAKIMYCVTSSMIQGAQRARQS